MVEINILSGATNLEGCGWLVMANEWKRRRFENSEAKFHIKQTC